MRLIGQGIKQWILWACAGLLLLSGCAATPPKTVEISGGDLQQVEDRLSRFLGQSCVSSVDSDVQLLLQAYGQEKKLSAVMQAMRPCFLRLAVTDPLGRPLMILGTDEHRFTFADNSESIGYTGSMDLDVVHKFLPAFIPTRDVFYWLSGRINGIGMQVLESKVDAAEDSLYWYTVEYSGSGQNGHNQSKNEGITHMLALNEKNQLVRHLVLDAEKDIQFEAKYSQYSSTPKACSWPGRIDISGEALESDFTVEFSEIFDFNPKPNNHFQIKLPPHFTVRKIINS
ncbi:MAG: hypothetical protein ACL93V_00695 [Candidatus Electrothrix sp. YB6]